MGRNASDVPSLLHEKLPSMTADDHKSSEVRYDDLRGGETSHRASQHDLTCRDMSYGDYINYAAERE